MYRSVRSVLAPSLLLKVVSAYIKSKLLIIETLYTALLFLRGFSRAQRTVSLMLLLLVSSKTRRNFIIIRLNEVCRFDGDIQCVSSLTHLFDRRFLRPGSKVYRATPSPVPLVTSSSVSWEDWKQIISKSWPGFATTHLGQARGGNR